MAVLGRGIALVEQADDKEALVVWGTRDVLRIARKDIAWNHQNMRWECEAKKCLTTGSMRRFSSSDGFEPGITSDC